MGLRRRLWDGAKATDTTLSLFDLAVRVIGASTVIGSGAAIVTWISANFYAALVVGLSAWVVVAVLALVLMGRKVQLAIPVGSVQNNTEQHFASEQQDKSKEEEIRERERERQQLIKQAEQKDSEIERLQELNKRLEADRDAFREEAERLSALQDMQLTDGQLKERCAELSQEMFQFADERDELDPQKNPEQNPGMWSRAGKETEHDKETARLYARQFGGRVTGALEDAERRDWIASDERKALTDKLKGSGYRKLTPPVREVAQRLEAIGHRL